MRLLLPSFGRLSLTGVRPGKDRADPYSGSETEWEDDEADGGDGGGGGGASSSSAPPPPPPPPPPPGFRKKKAAAPPSPANRDPWRPVASLGGKRPSSHLTKEERAALKPKVAEDEVLASNLQYYYPAMRAIEALTDRQEKALKAQKLIRRFLKSIVTWSRNTHNLNHNYFITLNQDNPLVGTKWRELLKEFVSFCQLAGYSKASNDLKSVRNSIFSAPSERLSTRERDVAKNREVIKTLNEWLENMADDDDDDDEGAG